MTTKDEAWENWTPRLTDLSKSTPTYHEAFGAGWDAVIEACGGSSHYVRLTESGWTLQHPITERLEGALFDCQFPHLIEPIERDLPLDKVVRVWLDRNALLWEEVS